MARLETLEARVGGTVFGWHGRLQAGWNNGEKGVEMQLFWEGLQGGQPLAGACMDPLENH